MAVATPYWLAVAGNEVPLRDSNPNTFEGAATAMSIWMLLIFAICMLAAVICFRPIPVWEHAALPIFLATITAFVLGVLSGGIRRPVA